MQKTTVLLLGAIVCMVLISGCTTGAGSGRTPLTNYRTGGQGIELQFKTNTPPSTIFAEDGSFPVAVEIYNRGVYPAEDEGALTGEIYFFGFDQRMITGLANQAFTFKPGDAKTRYNPEGGYDIVNLNAGIGADFRSLKIASYDTTINAAVCYDYITHASVDVCVDANINRNANREVCTPGVTSSGSQGAPIAVTSVESISQKGKARFIINIQNVGGGQAIDKSFSNSASCIDTDLPRSSIDVVTLQAVSLSSGQSLECTPNDYVTLTNGKATIVCKAEGLDEKLPAYRSIISIDLVYGYKKVTQTTIRILGE